MFLAVAAALKTIGCTKRNGADIPPTTGLHQQTNAVYYWKTAFKFSEQEKDFLQKEKIGRIYLHMFDVTVNEYGAVPNASVSFGTTVPSYIEIVPTVFITVDALSRAANANRNIVHTQRDAKEPNAHAIQQREDDCCDAYRPIRKHVPSDTDARNVRCGCAYRPIRTNNDGPGVASDV